MRTQIVAICVKEIIKNQLLTWCWHGGRYERRWRSNAWRSTYLSCGAERLPGTRTGKQRWAEPTTASCWSSHTDLHTLVLPVSLLFCHLLPSILSPSFLFFFLFCVCVCVLLLRSGRLGSHLEVIRILLAGLSSQLQAGYLTVWLADLGSVCAWLSPMDRVKRWPTGWMSGWLTDWFWHLVSQNQSFSDLILP